MEEVKQVSGKLGADAGGEMEARLLHHCQVKLGLDESLTSQVMILFNQTKHVALASMSTFGSKSTEEIEIYWCAFILYCASKLSKGSSKEERESQTGITLCQILRAFKLNIIDFFKEVPQFCIKAGCSLTGLYGSSWEKRLELNEMQANVVHLSLLSRYYRRAYQELFITKETSCTKNESVPGPDRYWFGWLLFLALRVHAFGRHKDLVTSTNGLVSVLAVLIIHMPPHLRNFSFRDTSLFAKRSEKGVNLISSLCNKYHTSEDELTDALEKTNKLITDLLKKNPCPISNFPEELLNFINPEGLRYFEDLLEEKSLSESIKLLENEYVDAINSKGEIDERVFVNEENSLLGSGSLSGGAVHLSGSKRLHDTQGPSIPKSITSPISPSRGPITSCHLSTPVSTTLTTARWLRTTVSPLSPFPSQTLLKFFSLSSNDQNALASEIPHRAKIILGAIFTTTSQIDSIWAEQRKTETLKLYYRVLESMCSHESNIQNSQKGKTVNLSPLLSNERFHRCMLACSAELVLATHKTVNMLFPLVLEKTGITGFDLSKIIEGFVRHEETLPRELKRHLNSLEEKLLESLAWEKGSNLYNSLIVARPVLQEEIQRLGLLADPMPSLDSIAANQNLTHGGLPPLPFPKLENLTDQNVRSPKRPRVELRLADQSSFRSPVKEQLNMAFSPLKSKLLHLQSSFASPTRITPAGGGQTGADTGIEMFFNKVTKLAAIRIKAMCERMGLQQDVTERVYSLLQLILSQQTYLFFNRHIDQIILCSIYAVCKISQMSLTFKEIILNYRKQPQCKTQVFRSVFVHWPSRSQKGKTGEDYVDIITFYNEVFIPAVKPLLVDLGPTQKNKKSDGGKSTADGKFPGSPRVSKFPNLPDMSPKKVSAAHNVYVSPLRSSKMDSLLSPSSKSYYACVGESTHAYQSPSKDLTAINNRLNCGRKVNEKLNFDMVSDSVVAGSFGSQNGLIKVKCEQTDS
ncbi:hypothetical protein LUZ60_015789 [Juncus effusus]|nr:hypothetical protein LUZ60_015789 [Juncus effusus]